MRSSSPASASIRRQRTARRSRRNSGEDMIKTILAALGIVAAPSGAAEHVSWPNLPKTGFVAARAATVEDIKAGNAVFSTKGTGGSAASMIIPQYVYWSDEHGTKHPMFLVQA